jgi:uncharacterized protein
VVWALIAIVGIYFSLLVACFLVQRRFIYQRPASDGTASASLRSITTGEFVTIETEDGEFIVAWYSPALDHRPVVVFFHGSADSPTHRTTRFLALTAEGFGVLAPYFRGFGRSTGSPTEAGLLRDARAAYSFCRRLYPPERIAIWGFSLGSAVAVLLAAKERIAALILEAPFTSLAAVAKHSFPFLPVSLILRDKYPAETAIAAVDAPILMMHGEGDRQSPISLGKLLFEAAPEPKNFVEFAGGGHADLDRHGALAVVRDFLSGVTNRLARNQRQY